MKLLKSVVAVISLFALPHAIALTQKQADLRSNGLYLYQASKQQACSILQDLSSIVGSEINTICNQGFVSFDMTSVQFNTAYVKTFEALDNCIVVIIRVSNASTSLTKRHKLEEYLPELRKLRSNLSAADHIFSLSFLN